MPLASLKDVSLYYEEAGSGFPLVLCHEFGGSLDSWRAQVHFFSRRYRVISFNARGYPPSDVPSDLKPRADIRVRATPPGGKPIEFTTVCRIDTPVEVDYYRNGGILQTVLRRMARTG